MIVVVWPGEAGAAVTARAYGGWAAGWIVIVPLVNGPTCRTVVQSAGS